jgi:outer membrane protein assembly factor BamB
MREFATLYAFAPDGTQKWSRNLSTLPSDAPAIAGDGTIYVGAGSLYAFAPDGTSIWSLGSGNLFDGLPVIGTDGTIYVGAAGSHTLYAVSPAGNVIWHNLSAGRVLARRDRSFIHF